MFAENYSMSKKEKNNRTEPETLSVRYQCPMVTINDVVAFINQTIARGGFSKPMTREKIGILYGKHPNQFIYLLSAGIQYGLLTADGSGYFPTARFNKLVSPVEDNDTEIALHEAIEAPNLYRAIIERYNGRLLPEVAGFINLFKGDFGLIPNTAEKGVKIFLQNANELKIIGENRKLKFLPPDADETLPFPERTQTVISKENGTQVASVNPSALAPIATPTNNMFPFSIQLTGD